MGVRGGVKRAAHEGLLLAHEFSLPSLSPPASRSCRLHQDTHTALGALAGMGWAGAARTKEPCTPHRVGRAAHLAPGTHHLFRAASSALGCGLGTDKSTLWQRRLYINCHFNCQSAL